MEMSRHTTVPQTLFAAIYTTKGTTIRMAGHDTLTRGDIDRNLRYPIFYATASARMTINLSLEL